jgi:hypothetical protein
MVINKSQGQILEIVGVYLQKINFYAWSIMCCNIMSDIKNGLKILIEDQDGNWTDETKNVVYKEVFSWLQTRDHP